MNRGQDLKLPVCRRARGYRIYDDRGRRFLDFFQDNGHAILGHRNLNIIQEMRNTLSRGQIAAYPAGLLSKTEQAIKRLIPGIHTVRIYRSFESAVSAAGEHLRTTVSKADISDPALLSQGAGKVRLWRPFLESETANFPVLLPILPIPLPPSPAVLVFREKPAAGVPASELCSPVSLAALKKSVFDLIKFIENGDRSGWTRFDAFSIWSRRGPYLTLHINETDFVRMYNDMLEHGILLSPRYPGPSIIPGEYTSGEIAYFNMRSSRG